MKTNKASRYSFKRKYRREKRVDGLETEEYTEWANSKNAYDYFKKNKPKIKKAGKVDRFLYSKIVNLFNKKIGEAIVNCSDGVYIEGMGYFGAIIYSDKVLASNRFYHEDFEHGVPLLNAHTDGKAYCLFFVHDKNKPISRTFVPDYSFSRTVTGEFSQALFDGKKYRYNATLFI